VVPAPNLNVIHPAVVIPVLEGKLEPGTTLLACAVWAGGGEAAGSAGAAPGGGLPRVTVQEKDPEGWNMTIFDNAGGIAAEISL
jgi:hypothetical protein